MSKLAISSLVVVAVLCMFLRDETEGPFSRVRAITGGRRYGRVRESSRERVRRETTAAPRRRIREGRRTVNDNRIVRRVRTVEVGA